MANPEGPQDAFNKNEDNIALKKQEIAEAAAAGDYDKVGALAQEAKGMETAKGEMIGSAQEEAEGMNKQIDAAMAAQEKAKREAANAEQAKLQAEKDAAEAAELLSKLQSDGTTPSKEPEVLAESAEDIDPAEKLRRLVVTKQKEISNLLMWLNDTENPDDLRIRKLYDADLNLGGKFPNMSMRSDAPLKELDGLLADLENLKHTLIQESSQKTARA